MEQPSDDFIYGNGSFSFLYLYFHFQLLTIIVVDVIICLSSLLNGLSLLTSAGDSGVDYSTKRSAEETEVQMLASVCDPMLP